MVLSMDRFLGKPAVVTGAGRGIGAAIAEKLVETGLQVVGIDIISENLDTMSKKLMGKKGKFHPKVADVTKEEDVVEVFKWTLDNLGPVHVLVNCAGIVLLQSLMDGDAQKWRKVFEVNVIGLCIATREAVRQMRAKDIEGHIIHINSISGHRVPDIPDLNVYPATKHSITALTETLRQELRLAETRIKITSISPGGVKTDIKGKSHGNSPKLQPEDIADAVVYAVSTPPHVQVHELTIKPVGEIYH